MWVSSWCGGAAWATTAMTVHSYRSYPYLYHVYKEKYEHLAKKKKDQGEEKKERDKRAKNKYIEREKDFYIHL